MINVLLTGALTGGEESAKRGVSDCALDSRVRVLVWMLSWSCAWGFVEQSGGGW